jgi:hypothetical protein
MKPCTSDNGNALYSILSRKTARKSDALKDHTAVRDVSFLRDLIAFSSESYMGALASSAI